MYTLLKMGMILSFMTISFLIKGNEINTSLKNKFEFPEKTLSDTTAKNKKPVESNFISLSKKGQKVLATLPLKYLGREFLLGATASSASAPDLITVGLKNKPPLHVQFVLQDSIVVLKSISTTVVHNKADSSKIEAINNNYRGPSIFSFKKEINKDSSVVVFDISPLVGKANPLMPVIPAYAGVFAISALPKSDLSIIKSVKSFEDNASVKTELSYNVSISIAGIAIVAKDLPFTAEITYSFLLLPSQKMTPRIFDSRVGVSYTNKLSALSDKYIMEPVYFANRWRIVPKDAVAFSGGALTEPDKPVIFYIDTTFPENWKKPVIEGVLRWNKAFEKIGFKNVIQVKDFPDNDSTFDPDNLKYSCIRYIPSNVEDAIGPSWTDPTTGEIINASIIVHNNVERLLHKWRFVQTAAVDSSVRAAKLPEKILEESLAYAIAHETGHALGFAHNMAASSAFPTDSLRSANFTKKHGVTPSIMDYARFNYVAQPTDKNVLLTPPELGIYDYYITDWAYRYYPQLQQDMFKEAKELEKMVDAKSGNPLYRYGREQIGGIFDPSALSEDLGDDAIKASNYGIQNLKYISANFTKWIKDDEDGRIKKKLDLSIAQQFHKYLSNVMILIGGIYQYETKESSGLPRYKIVPKEKQKQAVLWSIQQTKNFGSFANRAFEKKGYVEVSYYDQLLEYITMDLFRSRGRIIAASYLDKNAYTLQDFFDDTYGEIFKTTINGSKPSQYEKFMQRYFVNNALAATANSTTSSSKSLNGSTSLAEKFLALTEKFGTIPNEYRLALQEHQFGVPQSDFISSLPLKSLDKSDIYFYNALLKLQPLLKARLKTTGDEDLKSHYYMLLFKINNVLNKKK